MKFSEVYNRLQLFVDEFNDYSINGIEFGSDVDLDDISVAEMLAVDMEEIVSNIQNDLDEKREELNAE